MIEITIPGYRSLRLQHLVMDYNDTLAQDGRLLEGIRPRLESLAGNLSLHVITADTFGMARSQLEGLPCELVILPTQGQAQAKLAYVESLGLEQVVAIGNGRNDRLMLASAALGIAVVQAEGAAGEILAAADVVMPGICPALDSLLFPQRLVATLRG
ncbi:MAG: HAD hydrolase family protein [Anaerolineales bacterium]